jgi:hypothetical protein
VCFEGAAKKCKDILRGGQNTYMPVHFMSDVAILALMLLLPSFPSLGMSNLRVFGRSSTITITFTRSSWKVGVVLR